MLCIIYVTHLIIFINMIERKLFIFVIDRSCESDNSPSVELMKWAENIPIDELLDEIRDVINLPNLEFTVDIRDNDYDIIIDVKSSSLINTSTLTSVMFTGLCVECNLVVSEKNYKPFVEGDCRVAYIYTDRGMVSDAITIMHCYYDDKQGWVFKRKQ